MARPIRRLRTACERAKRTLSAVMQATIEVDSLYMGIDYQLILSRAKLEELCMDLFKKTIEPINQVLLDAHLTKDKVNEIVLVGGSSRIPKIKQMLSEYFGGKTLNESVNPDEAVAYGAAIQAAILSGMQDEKLQSIVLVDVTPLSLGLETVGGVMTTLIERNHTIPCRQTKRFSTYADNQTSVAIQIFEGERKFTVDNNKLGIFTLENLPPAPQGIPQIDVTFDIDVNGILNVTAVDTSSNKAKNITICNNRGRFTEEQINKMIAEAKAYEAADTARKEAIEARNRLEYLVHNIKQTVAESKIDSATKEKSTDDVAKMFQFIDLESTATKETYVAKKKIVENIWNPIITKIYTQTTSRQTETTTAKKTETIDTD